MPHTFRLFISSTFNDLKEERNALQQSVFPRLRDLCNEHGYRFQAIDLRWGISAEASLNQKTMRICLEELRRCQETTPTPNFLILLGNRYGWQPLPEILSLKEFESILSTNLSVEEQNIIQQWYKIDENGMPPFYELQPREGIFVDYIEWSKVEAQLREALSKSKIIKEVLSKSATEHEIINGLLEAKNSSKHVFCFSREFEFQKPIEQIVAENPEKSGIFFDITSENSKPTPNIVLQQQLGELKKKIEKAIPNNIYKYPLKWESGDVPNEYLRQLCQDVYTSLSKTILAEIEIEKYVSEEQFELQQHADFVKANWKDVQGRDSEIQIIRDYLEESQLNEPFVVIGESGSGKSSFMVRSIWDSLCKYPTELFLYRFVGLTPNSLSSESLLYSMIRELSEMLNIPVKLKSKNLSLLQIEFNRILEFTPPNKQLVIYIDALDRLLGYGNSIPEWIPTKLPAGVRLILSGTPQCFDSEFLSKIPDGNRVTLSQLSSFAAESILTNLLGKQQRKLQGFQKSVILNNYNQVGLPLYLSIAAGEAVRWSSHQANITLKPDIKGVINQVIDSLSLPEKHGEELVSKVLMFLAASKNGLTEDELLDLLAMDADYVQFLEKHHKIPIRKLPVALWARLYMDIKPYLLVKLADGVELYDFYHQSFKHVVTERYFANPANLASIRNTIITYYSAQNWNVKKCETTIYGRLSNARKSSELIYQLKENNELDALCNCLCDLNFIEAKCVAQGVDELLGDFGFLEANRVNLKKPDRYDQFSQFVVKESDVLRQYPELTLQQAINQNKLPLVRNEANEKILNLKRNISLFRLNQKQLDQDTFKWRLSSSDSGIIKYAVSLVKPVIAAISLSGNLLTLDATNGQIIQSKALGSANLNDCCFSGNGEIIAVLEGNYNVHLFSYNNLQRIETRTFSHFTERIAINHNGSLVAAWAGTDLSVTNANGESKMFQGHFKKINQVKIDSTNTKLLSVSNDYEIREWNIDTHSLIWKSNAHHDQVYSLDISSCGRYMVTSSVDEIIVWDKIQYSLIKRIKVPFCSIHSICIKTISDGCYRILTTSDDGYVRVYLAKEMKLPNEALAVFEPYELKLGVGPLSTSNFISGSDDQFFVEAENKNVFVIKLQLTQPEKKEDIGSTTVIRHNPQNGAIVWGTTDGYTVLTDSKGKVITNKFHDEYITDLIFSPSGDSIITSSGDKCVNEISPAHAVMLSVSTKESHKKTVRCLTLIKNGEIIASADDAGVINIYGLNDGNNFLEPMDLRLGALNILGYESGKPQQLSTGKSSPVLCLQQLENTDYLLAMDKSHFYFFNFNRSKLVTSVAHNVEMAYKFVVSNGKLFVVTRKGGIYSFSCNLSKPDVAFEKEYTQKSTQCNGVSLLNKKILVLANQNGTIQTYLLPYVSPIGIYSTGEPVMAIDTSGTKEITVGLASTRYLQLEFNLTEIVLSN